MTQKSIKRRPVRFAEIGEGFLRRFFRLSFSSAQNQGPVRRLKPSSSFLQCSTYRYNGLSFLSLAEAFAYRMPAKFRKAVLRGEKTKSTRLPLVRNPLKLREFFANS